MFEDATPVDNSVIILTENAARIIGNGPEFKVTQYADSDSFLIEQDDDQVFLSTRDEAEALFMVLDTMLHPDDEE